MRHPLFNSSLRITTVLALVLGLWLTAYPALAVDGVLEISQACVADGCFAGDSAGFPVTLANPGSYRLTSSLTVPDASTSAVELTASNVTLDLNGFLLGGPTVCSGEPIGCAPTGGGYGVLGSVDINGVTIRNGSIRGFGNYGIFLHGNGCFVEDVIVESNNHEGIRVGLDAVLVGNRVFGNGDNGIYTSGHSRVEKNVAARNGNHGITVGGFSLVVGNVSTYNESDGINASSSSTIQGNVTNNNDEDGIEVNSGSVVLENSSTTNGSWGIWSAQIGFGYGNNVLKSNGSGTVSNGVEIGSNLCDGSTSCP